MILYFLKIIFITSNLVSGYVIVLSGEGNIIQGNSAQFRASVLQSNGNLSTSEFIFTWSDNAIPNHTASFTAKSPAVWNVTYNSRFPPDLYKINVKVQKNSILIKTTVGSVSKTFDVTSFVDGEIILSQGNLTRKKYVSNAVPVNHHVVIKKSYVDFINKTKNFLKTFWFVDCVYYGQSNGYQFDFNYTKSESLHKIEALLVATYIPNLQHKKILVEKAVANNETSILTNSTSLLHSNNSINREEDYDVLDKSLKEWLDNFNVKFGSNISISSDYCINSSIVPIVSNYTYGFFKTNFTVKSPVKFSSVNGTNWLRDGEVLNINVSCNGSSPYSFCVLLKSGLYNISGNETCEEETMLRNCSFGIKHLFKKPSEYTLVVIISNAVSRVVKPIAINIYKVKKHAQLSVIIVPVSFSLIATILIIFGVAYYVQSKRKYTIEVADFDFGNQTSNMEYKSFGERLRESISNAFLKSNDYEDNDSAWCDEPPSSRKYGSMQ